MATTAKPSLKRARPAMPGFVRHALGEHGLMEAYKAPPRLSEERLPGLIKRAKQEATGQKRLGQMLPSSNDKQYMNMAWSGGRSPP